LKYLFLAEGREGLLRYASGAVHQTIYFPEVKAFHICYPEKTEQDRIVQQCDELVVETQRLAGLYQRKLSELEALKKSLLHTAFNGELTEATETAGTMEIPVVTPFPMRVPNISSTDLQAGIFWTRES
jgi:type I restriction enzyme S subunit